VKENDGNARPQRPDIEANLAAIRIVRQASKEARNLTEVESEIVARWRGWGGLPEAFLPGHELNKEVRALLGPAEYRAAAHSTLNAHYTDPAIVRAMWDFLVQLGYKAKMGEVLEPGCGHGNFITHAPKGVKVVGVELDPITAQIAQALNPEAEIVCDDFITNDTLGIGRFAAMNANVPFGDYEVYDSIWNEAGWSIHNAFISKGLALMAYDGVMVCITSRHTVDSNRDEHLEAIAEIADCLGVIRLPGSAHVYAGTQVVTDIVVFQKRLAPKDKWARKNRIAKSENVDVLGVEIGDRDNGRIGAYQVKLEGSLPKALKAAFQRVIEKLPEDFRFDPVCAEASSLIRPNPMEGVFFVTPSGNVQRVVGGVVVDWSCKPAKEAVELAKLVRLRDSLKAVLAAQEAFDDPLKALQEVALNEYSEYVAEFGYVSRHVVKKTETDAGETDADGNAILEEEIEYVYPKMGGFRSDPTWHVVGACEIWNEDDATGKPAPVFFQRVAGRAEHPTEVDTVADAVHVAMDRDGIITVEAVAELLRVSETDATEALRVSRLAFLDPQTGEWEAGITYLSGDVRTKLRAAEEAQREEAETGIPSGRFTENVKALTEILPPTVSAGDIDTHPGSPWVEQTDLAAFCKEVAGVALNDEVKYDAWTGSTSVSVWGSAKRTFNAKGADFEKLFNDILNQRRTQVKVTLRLADGREVERVSRELSAQANEARQRIIFEFKQWLLADGVRSGQAAERYNTRFNCYVTPKWDSTGLALPGLSQAFTPYQHQLEAVSWLRHNHGGLLGHPIGSGKSATSIVTAMELKRLGIARRPAIVVPNHMLEQFAAEYYRLYPNGNALVATKDDLSAANRRMFVARVATGDWDVVIFTHSSFGRLPVSEATAARYEQHIYNQKVGDGGLHSGSGKQDVKRMEKRRAKASAAAKKARASLQGDQNMVTFEQTGIDFIFADESHLFKKLPNASSSGYSSNGSARARDLHAKVNSLRQRFGKGRLVLMTGTWITNTLAEAWVVSTFIQPEKLEAKGVAAFDRWLAAFGRFTEKVELDASGAGYVMKERLDTFVNAPELLAMIGADAHFLHEDDLGLDKPEVIRTTETIDPDPVLTEFTLTLGERAKACKGGRGVDPKIDNILKIATEGRQAALSVKLVGLTASDPENTKAAVAARGILTRWKAAQGNPDKTLQLVFCDIGIHGGNSVYTELKELLIAGGMPASKVRFATEPNTDAEKAELFRLCRNGSVNVLIASTAKAGLGTNIQDGLFAIHHLDGPWRPDEVKQRDGRGIRPGNRNKVIEIVVYVVVGSFDTFMWQTLERKERTFGPVRYGKTASRTIVMDDSTTLNYAEIKAATTANPDIIEKAEVDAKVARLTASRDNHAASEKADRAQILWAETGLETESARLVALENAKNSTERAAETLGSVHAAQRGVSGDWARSYDWAENEKLGLRLSRLTSEGESNFAKLLMRGYRAAVKAQRASYETAVRWSTWAERGGTFEEWDKTEELDALLIRQSELEMKLGALLDSGQGDADEVVAAMDEVEIRQARARAGDSEMADDPEEEVRYVYAAQSSNRLGEDSLRKLAADPSVKVRAAIANRVPSNGVTDLCVALMGDEAEVVRETMAKTHNPCKETQTAYDALLSDDSQSVRVAALRKCSLNDVRVAEMLKAECAGVEGIGTEGTDKPVKAAILKRTTETPESLCAVLIEVGMLEEFITAFTDANRYSYGNKTGIPAVIIRAALNSPNSLSRSAVRVLAKSAETFEGVVEIMGKGESFDSELMAEMLVKHLADGGREQSKKLNEAWFGNSGEGASHDSDIEKLLAGGAWPNDRIEDVKAALIRRMEKNVTASGRGFGWERSKGRTLIEASLKSGLFSDDEWHKVSPYASTLPDYALLNLDMTAGGVLGRIGRNTNSITERVKVANHRNAPGWILAEWAVKSSSSELVRACISNRNMPAETLETLAGSKDQVKAGQARKVLDKRSVAA
jgi:N12 class adenine-specific DNA methylase